LFGNLIRHCSILDDAYYDAITAKLRQIQGQVQYSTLYKQYLSKTHTRRREWLSNNADLNLYGILQELPFMAGKEFVGFQILLSLNIDWFDF